MDRDLVLEFDVLKEAINYRYPRQENPYVNLTARGALRLLLTLTRNKAAKVYALHRQHEMRTDRCCSVEVALKSDLAKISQYLDSAGPHDRTTPDKIWKWMLALVWPLNQTIYASPQMPAGSIPARMLVDGIAPDIVQGIVQSGRMLVTVSSHYLRELLWVNLTSALETMIMATWGKTADERQPVQELVTFLKEQLGLGAPSSAEQYLNRINLASKLDVAVKQTYWEQIRWPMTVRGDPPTTHATWLCDALDKIEVILHEPSRDA
ncbi:hypothetical protein JCM10908_001470 [Rhodotorula pacifica]|uniref:uncharacterized protein n=1 Tax=Rhodotorula pacifica TaxID=1495444 RepID=UPI00316E7173